MCACVCVWTDATPRQERPRTRTRTLRVYYDKHTFPLTPRPRPHMQATFYRLASLRSAIESRNATSAYYLRERAEATRPVYDTNRPTYEASGPAVANTLGYRSAELPDPFGFSTRLNLR